MYLSQLIVNPRSREVRRDLADRYELHRTISSGFPPEYPVHERVLYRVENSRYEPAIKIIVQSQSAPDWSGITQNGTYLLAEPRLREVTVRIQNGQRLPFRLQANPTCKRNNKRCAIYDEPGLIEWLQRKGENHGFAVGNLDIQIAKLGKQHGKRQQQTWHVVQFDGVLTITNSSLLGQSIQSGIGSGKGFGFGLLSIPYPA